MHWELVAQRRGAPAIPRHSCFRSTSSFQKICNDPGQSRVRLLDRSVRVKNLKSLGFARGYREVRLPDVRVEISGLGIHAISALTLIASGSHPADRVFHRDVEKKR